MGFWDSVGSLAKGAVNSINEYNAEFQARKEKMEAKSNDELWRIVKDDGFFGSSKDDKKMAYYVLKQRGEV
ncbi:transposase [Pasteurella sp. PK-2025]|uniref:transposase n=1 Tax=Pasteurella sp. PK-2025 TaxID=3413133 RepID=UPI003C755C2C